MNVTVDINLTKKLDTLSKLSRETKNAGYIIQHNKATGLYKVVFQACLVRSKEHLKLKPIDEVLDDAINFIKKEREELSVEEKYTL